MIQDIHIEVMLAAGYAVFLAMVAALLEWLARHSHRRSENYRNAGFSYKRDLDQWQCPMGLPLYRSHTDHEKEIAYYRASAHDCNACSLKINCTDSEEGRVIESRIDLWVESELRKFHRGISIALLTLAALILVAEMVRHPGPRELGLLSLLLVPLGIAGVKAFSSFLSATRAR